MSRLHDKQNQKFRDPAQIVGLWGEAGVNPRSLGAHADKGWNQTLKRLGVTLLVTREYEHLVLALGAGPTTWLQLPHPSGLVVDREGGAVHIACTRNPNLLMELRGETLLPTRVRFFPGSLYLHDLALIGGKLHANAVGQNAVVRLDYDQEAKRVWWPACIERDGKPVFQRNHLQLNSIAAGKTLKESFFSASLDQMLKQVPGDQDYPVDRRGVLFSGRTRQPVAYGLTRPHSARFHGKELWVNNSGYGQVGRIVGKHFEPLVKLESWTRGLCFVKEVLFVGLSKLLPRFHAYAPGLDYRKSQCGVVAIDTITGQILGKIIWPHGNQIFAIDWIKHARLPFDGKNGTSQLFYNLNIGRHSKKRVKYSKSPSGLFAK
jgi:uncharacterized protein (TIGR03032 family)